MNEQAKIRLLRKLVKEYANYLDLWHKATVRYDKFSEMIAVTFYNEIETINEHGIKVTRRPFTRREFGISYLDERIKSYRNKINYAKSKRDD